MHGLDPDTWKDVEVVYIDIADKRQIDSKVCDLKKNKQTIFRCDHFIYFEPVMVELAHLFT